MPATSATIGVPQTRNAGTLHGADPGEYVFDVKFRKGGKVTLRAAYVQYGATAAQQATPAAATPDTPVTLKDADGKILFLAPSAVILSVTRKGQHPAGSAPVIPPVQPGIRRIDPDAEAARLAEERKQATEAAQPHCRFCEATAPIPLMRAAEGWQCLDGIDCFGRQGGVTDG